MRLGELIGIARECKGWTLRELEKAAGVSNPLISQIESGKVKDPGFSTVVRLTDALGISIERARDALAALQADAPADGWVSVEVTKLLAVHDALVDGDTSEAFHQLRLIADPDGGSVAIETGDSFSKWEAKRQALPPPRKNDGDLRD